MGYPCVVLMLPLLIYYCVIFVYLWCNCELLVFAVNGKMLYSGEDEAAFKGFEIGAGFVPAVTLAVGQEVALHFGKQIMVM